MLQRARLAGKITAHMDHSREGIGLRGYGTARSAGEYKKESFEMFEAMLQRFQEDTARYLYLMHDLSRRPPDSGRVARPQVDPRALAQNREFRGAGQWRATGIIARTGRKLRLTIWKKASCAASARRIGTGSMAGPGSAARCSRWWADRRKGWPQRSLPLRLGERKI